ASVKLVPSDTAHAAGNAGGTRYIDAFGLAALFVLRNVQHQCSIPPNEADRVAYLQPLMEAVRRGQRLWIATLNYDRTVEIAAEMKGIEVDRGVTIRSEDTPAQSKPDVQFKGTAPISLVKLHGSVDWYATGIWSKLYVEP